VAFLPDSNEREAGFTLGRGITSEQRVSHYQKFSERAAKGAPTQFSRYSRLYNTGEQVGLRNGKDNFPAAQAPDFGFYKTFTTLLRLH
jgi:hypothetical protein